MANLQIRRNKDGVITSVTVRVFRGRDGSGKQLKPYTSSFKPPAGSEWSEKTIMKKAAEYAAVFEKECKEGIASDTRQTFEAYAEYVVNLKESRGLLKHSTICRYRDITKRLYPLIGHIKIKDLRAEHLNDVYTALAADGMNKRSGGKLSNKTILEHHRFISTVLGQAVKEGLVPFNVAQRAEPPKVKKKEAQYFQPAEITKIREAFEKEPIMWQTFIHLLLITGARRGEILGLKWDRVDFKKNEIKIDTCILYSSDIGVYEETPKTEKSKRTITLPAETMELLKRYRARQYAEQEKLFGGVKIKGYVFTNQQGEPMNPDTANAHIKRFAQKNHLQNVHPHAFRHTMASILINGGADIISVSKRLGHAQPSTTANIYAHVIEGADRKNADLLADVMLKNAKGA